jgi:hypothetical protein
MRETFLIRTTYGLIEGRERGKKRFGGLGGARADKYRHTGNAANLECLDIALGFSNLAEGVSETLAGLCQLALEGVDLLCNILKLFFGKRSSPDDLMSFAVRFAQRAPDFRCDLIELALLSHSRLLK